METKKIVAAVVSVMVLAAIAIGIAIPVSNNNKSDPQANAQRAKSILTEEPIFDGHNDWPYAMRYLFNNTINDKNLESNFEDYMKPSHTDIKRLRQGNVGGQFWSCFVSCNTKGKDAIRQGLQQMDVIKRMISKYPNDFGFVRTYSDIEKAQNSGKIASTIGVEGGHMIGSSLAVLRVLHELGARYMTLTHSCDIPWATAFNSPMTNKGLSSFGKLVVKEMNRLGMLVDLAHVNDKTMNDAFDVTRSPVIMSHSSARSLCDISRNVPDEALLRLKENNGVIMVNFYNNYVTCNNNATTSDVADHYDHIKSVIGTDHIGVGGDYDGVPRTPEGLEDVSKYPNLVEELLNRGWTEEEIKKISGGNIKRVFKEAEEIATKLQNEENPIETWIEYDAIKGDCITP